MSNKKKVFRKAVELHRLSGRERPVLSPSLISEGLQLSLDETMMHLDALSQLRLIRLGSDRNVFEVTRIGLSTTMGNE